LPFSAAGTVLKQHPDLALAGVLIHHTYVRSGDLAVTIDQQRHRQGIDSAV
jgi:hypothetical protein